MPDNITNVPLESAVERLPTSETAVINLEGGRERERGSAPEQSEDITAAAPAENLGETSTIAPVESQPRPANQFVITVGRSSRQFTLDINDLRRESSLFRESRIITSIELRHEQEEAIEVIWQWFSDALGEPPLSEEARNLYHEAARIARQLQIRECESQLLVIVQKTITTLAQVLTEQMGTGRVWTQEQLRDYVCLEMEGYMARSTNVGGEDEESEGGDLDDLLRALD